MNLTVAMLLKCISLLDETRLKCTLACLRRAVDVGCKSGIISVTHAKEYREIKRTVFPVEDYKKHAQVLQFKEVLELITRNKLLKNYAWNLLVPLLFLTVPANKYASANYIIETLDAHGCTGKKYPHIFKIRNTLNYLFQKGVLERVSFTESNASYYGGGTAKKDKIAWCGDNVHEFDLIRDRFTQSVFRLTPDERKRGFELYEELSVPMYIATRSPKCAQSVAPEITVTGVFVSEKRIESIESLWSKYRLAVHCAHVSDSVRGAKQSLTFEGVRDLALFCFDEQVSNGDIVQKMEECGYQPASVWDLVGLHKKIKRTGLSFDVVSIGTVYEVGDLYAYPILRKWGDATQLHSVQIEYMGLWSTGLYFLARKIV